MSLTSQSCERILRLAAPGACPRDDTMAEIGVHPRGLPGLPEDHSRIPVWNAEDWYYEDFAVGDRIRSIRRTIAEGESMLFNSLVMDHHPYVSDERFAARRGSSAPARGRGLRLLARARARGDELPELVLLRLRPAPLHQAGVHRRHDLHYPREPLEGGPRPPHGQAARQLLGLQGRGRARPLCRAPPDRALPRTPRLRGGGAREDGAKEAKRG
jgi:hypothetical protein